MDSTFARRKGQGRTTQRVADAICAETSVRDSLM
jgi:hypothetical protein